MHQTVIIFDWDDTLLCTSFLNLRNQAPNINSTVNLPCGNMLLVHATCVVVSMTMGSFQYNVSTRKLI